METEISGHLFKATRFTVICYPAKKTNILTSINIEKDWHSRPEQESPWIPIFSSVQSFSCVRLLATPWTVACQASLSSTNSQSPPKPMFIELVIPSSHFILCRLLLLLPSIFPSIRVLSNESALRIMWQKYRSFSFSISPSNEHPGLISDYKLLSYYFPPASQK